MRRVKKKECQVIQGGQEEGKRTLNLPRRKWEMSYLTALSRKAKKGNLSKKIKGVKDQARESYRQVPGALEGEKGVAGREVIL